MITDHTYLQTYYALKWMGEEIAIEYEAEQLPFVIADSLKYRSVNLQYCCIRPSRWEIVWYTRNGILAEASKQNTMKYLIIIM